MANFPYCNGTCSIYVCICKSMDNEALALHTQCARASLFCQFMDRNIYGTGYVKIWKSCHKISMDIRISFTVQLNIGNWYRKKVSLTSVNLALLITTELRRDSLQINSNNAKKSTVCFYYTLSAQYDMALHTHQVILKHTTLVALLKYNDTFSTNEVILLFL